MMNRLLTVLMGGLMLGSAVAQQKSLVNMAASPHVVMHAPDMGSVHWTGGFWANRLQVCRDSTIPAMWKIYNDAAISHAFKNFEIAAGLDTGMHKGPSFHDGDFYKVLEALAAMYAVTGDEQLNRDMDRAIAVIAKAQQADGYIYTKGIIDRRRSGVSRRFDDRLSFEAYNIGHLLTAACVHHRATGKTTLLNVAVKAADFLEAFYNQASPEVARNAICPSHYMGLTELYRTTRNRKYLQLAAKLIDIRGEARGSDDNSDRYPFRQMQQVQGHAVRANYLFAGAADVYAENGDTSLLNTLNRIWNDVTLRKMYITGGCGALHDGVSNDGTSYNPDDVEKLHQAYGRAYQLPQFTAHNETCANIGNVLWNYRMLAVTGDARYADVLERTLYNSVLSGVGLNGKDFLYTNPLAWRTDLPFTQRWSKQRVPYISLSNCCPPNVVRTMAEVSNYAYSLSNDGVWVHLYGASTIKSKLPNGTAVHLSQHTDYPWSGNIQLKWEEDVTNAMTVRLRIPGWAVGATVTINGQPVGGKTQPGTYLVLARKWKKGDKIQLQLPMKPVLMAANPMVEEVRNQVAVQYGPLVYCAESAGVGGQVSPFELALSPNAMFTTKKERIGNMPVLTLQTQAKRIDTGEWQNQLYKPLKTAQQAPVRISLVPYFAWGNRGVGDMTVWLPVRG